MSAYESGVQKLIPATLVYARDPEGRILMLHRALGKDLGARKWNGLGGKVEAAESPRACAAREFFEEAGLLLEADRFSALGVLHFPNFKPHRHEDWTCWVYDVSLLESECLRIQTGIESPDGRLEWVASSQLLDRALWEGDSLFLPWVLERRPFSATLWYEAGALIRVEGPHPFG